MCNFKICLDRGDTFTLMKHFLKKNNELFRTEYHKIWNLIQFSKTKQMKLIRNFPCLNLLLILFYKHFFANATNQLSIIGHRVYYTQKIFERWLMYKRRLAVDSNMSVIYVSHSIRMSRFYKVISLIKKNIIK